jgi:cell shape-determining protein MreD
MAVLIGTFLLGLAVIVQTTIISRMTLLHGPADLVLLVLLGWILHKRVSNAWAWGITAGFLVGIPSALPIWIPIFAYVLVSLLTKIIQTRIWQAPILILLTTTFLSTIVIHSMSYGYLVVTGINLPFIQSLNLVILPSMILNMLLALPVYGLLSEITNWLYPFEE